MFKAIFETKNTYPNAYTTAVRYRTWLTNEIYSQLRALNPDASFNDAKLFLYMIEGAVIQRLSSDEVDGRVVEVFLRGWGEKEIILSRLPQPPISIIPFVSVHSANKMHSSFYFSYSLQFYEKLN